MDSLTSRALCAFREQLTKEANRQWAIVVACAERGEKSSRKYVATDRMLKAATDAWAVNDMLGGEFDLTRDGVMEREYLDIIRKHLGDKAELAYEAAESRMEEAALRKFHHDAFGE